MTETSRRLPGTVWLRKHWNLRHNPFPNTGIARLGGDDSRENGLLYEPDINASELTEAIDKFVLGAAFSGQKFGYLWSIDAGHGTSDARGYGKSVLMQHLVGTLNEDFGRSAYLDAGLEGDDAAEVPICGLLTSFDTTQIRSLSAALFTAVEYAVKFRVGDKQSLAQRLRARLVDRVGDDDVATLVKSVADVHRALRGRTLGPPDEKLVRALCEEGPEQAVALLSAVKPTTRTRNGAAFLSTFLLYASAAGISKVLLCCDQLEDLASTNTAKSKRDLEVERFRDVILETLPMADMLSVVVTMHPRAALTIGTAWQLADLPSFERSEANKRSYVVLPGLRSTEAARKLLARYLADAVKDGTARAAEDMSPFSPDAITVLFQRSSRKPRDVLRKAHILVESAAVDNLERIDADTVDRYLDALGPDPEDSVLPGVPGPAVSLDWNHG